ncbi:hypothetical protein CPS_1369 [Colwellia psychrerythraea 34H]|uniref:Uncharacterized protein n=1 Tax=Colwellia psychrerythraea (strain 34H / ATCC BAA-681) TaxID=167879 RepID=Q486A3_COLP3|nr:hypothetical protein CPS_1369 [Colwellia psychrerythraea 34H]
MIAIKRNKQKLIRGNQQLTRGLFHQQSQNHSHCSSSVPVSYFVVGHLILLLQQ